jgi:hypothetical protein
MNRLVDTRVTRDKMEGAYAGLGLVADDAAAGRAAEV